jgi:PAS domain S-box-containing protein/putative nucleotidyltransferase with HDIG domain
MGLPSSHGQKRTPAGSMTPLRFAGVYLLISAAWIFLTDTLLASYFSDPAALTVYQTYKGWLFVAVMAVLIYFSVARDIAARGAAAREVQISQERFATIFHASPVAISYARIDDGLLLDVNAAYATFFGYERDELIGSSAERLWEDPRDRQAVIRALRAGRAVRGVEGRFRRKDGSVREGLLSMEVLHAEGGALLLALVVDISEQKRAAAMIRQQLDRLRALHAIDRSIAGGAMLSETLQTVAEQACESLDAAAAAVLLRDASGSVAYAARAGHRHAELPHAARVMLDITFGVSSAPLSGGAVFTVCHAAPLIVRGVDRGVLIVCHDVVHELDDDRIGFVETLAGQAAIAIENSALQSDLQRTNAELIQAYEATIEGWSRALDLRDKETEGHTLRVTELTVDLARAVGMDDEAILHVRRGALLHDIGKMGVPDHILLKPGPLTEEEWAIMRRHPTFAYELLAPITFLGPALDIPYCHHERWDGGGYPRGLKGEQIPLAARLFAVVDVWDAIISDRPYRQALPHDAALAHIRAGAGAHFDPRAVELFLERHGAARDP